jgi:D-glycero-D-manno-heptose 1,7-bisphosphate phosphatase
MQPTGRPAIFWDRDGVINVSPGEGYVLRWADFHLSPGVVDALKLCHARGYALVLVTSQQGVGKGLMSMADLEDIHHRLQDHLQGHGLQFDMIQSCTHLKGSCTCRKPSPEMILTAAKALNLDLTRSWVIGDHDRDIEMGLRAGVQQSIRVLSHHSPGIPATHTVSSPSELAAVLERVLPVV